MKKALIISLATCGMLAGAFGQGTIVVDNTAITPALDINTVGNLFSGTYGLQVYVLNNGGASVPGGINNAVDSSAAFANMLAAGYVLEHSYINQTITPANAGSFSLGTLTLPDVSPAGANTTIALVAWVGSGNSFSSSFGGVITFANPTGNPNSAPPGTPKLLSGWNALGQDLVMAIPEPSVFTLAGMGASALIIFRRRHSRQS